MKVASIWSLISISLLCFFGVLLTGCGGSGSSNDSPSVRVASPESESQYRAGEVIDFALELDNFHLVVPFSHRSESSVLRDHPVDTGHEEDTSHDDSHGDSHSDTSTMLNPSAREGHYHVYLDAASGTDPHLTLWEAHSSYQIPSEVSLGMHTLRFELRDNNHVPVGVETVLFFEVVESE